MRIGRGDSKRRVVYENAQAASSEGEGVVSGRRAFALEHPMAPRATPLFTHCRRRPHAQDHVRLFPSLLLLRRDADGSASRGGTGGACKPFWRPVPSATLSVVDGVLFLRVVGIPPAGDVLQGRTLSYSRWRMGWASGDLQAAVGGRPVGYRPS